MDEIKKFVKDHKKEIIFGTCLIFAYKLGFKRGCEATDNAVCNLFREAAKAIDIKRF